MRLVGWQRSLHGGKGYAQYTMLKDRGAQLAAAGALIPRLHNDAVVGHHS